VVGGHHGETDDEIDPPGAPPRPRSNLQSGRITPPASCRRWPYREAGPSWHAALDGYGQRWKAHLAGIDCHSAGGSPARELAGPSCSPKLWPAYSCLLDSFYLLLSCWLFSYAASDFSSNSTCSKPSRSAMMRKRSSKSGVTRVAN
jgi:hypothetical protein